MASVRNLYTAAPVALRPLRRDAGRRTTVAAARPRNSKGSKGDDSAVPEQKVVVNVPSDVPAGVEQVLQPMTPMHRSFRVQRHASDAAKGRRDAVC